MTLNTRTVNVILVMLITLVRVFWQTQLRGDVGDVMRLISRSEEKKITLRGKGGRKVNNNK